MLLAVIACGEDDVLGLLVAVVGVVKTLNVGKANSQAHKANCSNESYWANTVHRER